MMHKGKGILLFLFFFALPLLTSGCATIDHIYTSSYKKLTLSHAQLAHDGIAVLPMAYHYNEEDYFRSAQVIFLRTLKGILKDIELVEPARGVLLAREAGVYESFKQLIETDLQKEVPREILVRKVGRALGKRYLLRTELVKTLQTEGATQLQLRAQIWDVDLGEMVWEGLEESRGYVILIFPQSPAPLEKVMETASTGLIRKMP